MRRGAGIGAIKNKKAAQAKFKDKGSELASEQLQQMSKQIESFRSFLEEFASKHKDKIRKNAEFRNQFQQMCATIGVDPLASGKGFWAQTLGVGDFYYELGVQVVEVCLAISHRNGGLISLDELLQRVTKSRGSRAVEVSQADLVSAIKKLRALGSGFVLLPFGSSWLVQSVPGELTMDHTTVIGLAESDYHVSEERLRTELGWGEERIERAMGHLLSEGLAWLDDQGGQNKLYWFPGLFPACIAAT